MSKPKNSKYTAAMTNLDKEVIVIDSDSDTDTDDVGGGTLLALCGEVKLLENDGASKQIVCHDDDFGSVLDYEPEYKKYLANFSVRNTSSPMRLTFNVDGEASGKRRGRPVKTKKPSKVSGGLKKVKTENGGADHKSVLVKEETIREERKAKSHLISRVSKKKVKTEDGRVDHKSISVEKPKSMAGRKPKFPSISRVSKRVKTEDDRAYHKPVSLKKAKSKAGRKPKFPSISPISKRVKTEDDRADHKSISVKKAKSRAGRKPKVPSISRVSKRVKTENDSTEHKSIPRTKEIQQKTGDGCLGMKNESTGKRNAKPQTIFRASKRLKTENESSDYYSIGRTIPVVSTKDIKQKKREAPRGRKINEPKNRVESKSTSYVKDDIVHPFKARKKVNEERLLSIDKGYAYYLEYLRNSITIFKPDQQVKPVNDLVCFSDPDIIAISDYPFTDGDIIPFETDKDDRVLDLEDSIEHDEMFNSSFSNKLMEILRKPYDENERLQLCYEVKLKRPLTRTRQLRDGREIEYNVDNQLTKSYLEQYTDFKKKFCRHKKDRPRALNLLRGFFFYFENIVLEGAFKPWTYEKRLEDMCFDARGCKQIEYNK